MYILLWSSLSSFGKRHRLRRVHVYSTETMVRETIIWNTKVSITQRVYFVTNVYVELSEFVLILSELFNL